MFSIVLLVGLQFSDSVYAVYAVYPVYWEALSVHYNISTLNYSSH